MARQKKAPKAKEPIRIRFKELANGNQSIYLDIYKNGKRSYEFLKLYIVPETSETAKAQNANQLQAANAIKAQRIIELTNDAAGISNTSNKAKMLLADWMHTFMERKERTGRSDNYAKQVSGCINYLIAYKGEKVTMKQVDKEFCKGFIDFLKVARQTNGNPLSTGTVCCYCSVFVNALNLAVRENIIPFNPFTKIDPDEKVQKPESTREYLTVEEVKKLIATDCKHEAVKRAFLFSCFCGLRHSDIIALTWGNIERSGEDVLLRITARKTNKLLTLPLSDSAQRWLSDSSKAKNSDRVFVLPKSEEYHNRLLKRWVKEAGIKKTVTFHVARHTFATLELTAGANLYTTSKLLGHSNVKTTQIYAKIIDKKKIEAVNLVSNLFND